jgi:transcriptional regulator GlxA family with amidase domain
LTGRRFAILAYDGIEPIDIGATYGVLSMAKRVAPDLAFWVVAKTAGEVVMANGLRLLADHGFDDAPDADWLIVLGGPGWDAARRDAAILDHVRAAQRGGVALASVCTGGMILAAAGVLAGRKATTKREILPGEARPLDLLAQSGLAGDALEARVVDTGDVVTAGGVSLGVDLTLHLIRRTCGAKAAVETARILEYDRAWDANAASLPDIIEAG